MDERLADLLLDPAAAPENVTTHVAGCEDCRRQLEELRATMALLDTWEVPEPNPFFMTRFQARLDEERKAAPASWPARMIARMRARILYGPQMHARPLAAMALTVLLFLGGGAYLESRTGSNSSRLLTKPRWWAICKRWTVTRNCWTSLKPSTGPADSDDDDLNRTN